MSLLSCNASNPVYFVLVEKKGQTIEKLQDRYGHVIFLGELYLEGRNCRSPVHVIQAKRKSRFSTILFTLALMKLLKHLSSLIMI